MTDPSPDCGYTPEEQAAMDAVDANPGPNCVTAWEPEPMPRFDSYQAMKILLPRPRSWREATYIAWGADIFLHQIPLLKLTLALVFAINALFWWLLS